MKEATALVRSLAEVVKQDGEHIRALARIADIHEPRLTTIKGEEDGEK